jgi:hypothetical protein
MVTAQLRHIRLEPLMGVGQGKLRYDLITPPCPTENLRSARTLFNAPLRIYENRQFPRGASPEAGG